MYISVTFDANFGQILYHVVNGVDKDQTACFFQSGLDPQYLLKTPLGSERLNSWLHNPDFWWPWIKKPFENIVGKGENAGNQHFLLFPAMFSIHPKKTFFFDVTFILLSAYAFNLDQSKNLSFGKDLNLSQFWITRRQNFRMVQMETNCRQHFKVHLKWKISPI